jgi:hypothetical protein
VTSGRRALCLGLLLVACDLKVGEQETKAPGRRARGKRPAAKSGGLVDDPAVVQATVELEREAGLHLRLIGDAEAADGRSPGALREAVLRRGGGRISAERVHVQAGEAGEAVRFEFFAPAVEGPAVEGPPPTP